MVNSWHCDCKHNMSGMVEVVLRKDYDLLESSAKYFGECNAKNADEANLLGKRVKDLEAALRQSRPYVYNAEVADAADLEARYATLSLIDGVLPQSTSKGVET